MRNTHNHPRNPRETMYSVVLLGVFHAVSGASGNGSSLISRDKRQSYYICGSYPNQYYSYYPCAYYPTQAPGQCANGGKLLGVGCYYDYQCSAYSNGAPYTCLNGCCCSVPAPAPAATTPPSYSTLGYCYNGQRSAVRCSSTAQCASGQSCMNNLCCTTTGNEWQNACGGLAALASCQSGGGCGAFSCTSSNYCCECVYGRTSGTCANGCPAGYSCSSSGYCCAQCSSGLAPMGSCYNGLCPQGYTCRPGNICC